MMYFIQRLILAISEKGWKISAGIMLTLFVFGWVGFLLIDPTTELARPSVYWWWFVVTVTTVGYGDFFPDQTGTRLIAAVIVIGGIAAMGVVFTQLTTLFIKIRGAIMDGTAELHVRDHILILGYHEGIAPGILDQLETDPVGRKREVVLAFSPDQATENPLPGRVQPVKGVLTSDDVMKRTCADRAARIIIAGHDDNETLAIAVAVSHVNQSAHIVAAVENQSDTGRTLRRLDGNIECVPANMISLIVEGILDPGITRLYASLMSNLEGQNGFQVDVPEDAGPWRYGDLMIALKRDYDATLIAVGEDHDPRSAIRENPGWDTEVRGGQRLFYIAGTRIQAIHWDELAV